MTEARQTHTAFFELVSALSTAFVTARHEELSAVNQRALAVIGHYFNADRTYIFEFSPDRSHADNTYEWCAPGVSSQLEHLQNIATADFYVWFQPWHRGEVVQISDVTALPENSPERALLAPQGIRSVIMLPLHSSDGLLGMFGIDLVRAQHVWTEEEAAALKLVAGNLCGSLLRGRAVQQLRTLALYDPVTELPNRHHLGTLLTSCAIEARSADGLSGLLLLDLDHFKTLNDSHGHQYGDLLLVELAARLSALLQPADILARVGGDEFALVMRDLAPSKNLAEAQLKALAERAMQVCGQVFHLGDIEHRISLSVGACVFQSLEESVDVLLKHAELAMYQAKAAGRDTLRFYDSAMQAQANARAALGRELRTAIEDQQWVLHYQPQFDLDSRVVGAEALIRWEHPTRGIVAPPEFIPFAEESGLIIPIGQWVLRQACRQLALWSELPPFKHVCISVNISLLQFQQPDFVDQVRSALAATGADATRLKLEITESLLAVDITDVIEKMTQLQAEGVGFSLDDFGTGYSSLSYLKRLPLTEVKIDKSFVRDILADSSDVAIAKMVVALADCMDLGVVAEGVENAAQRDLLAQLGCQCFQGFWFSKPLDIVPFEQRFGG